MCAAGPTSIHALLPAHQWVRINAVVHGQDWRTVFAGSVERQPPDGGIPAEKDSLTALPRNEPHVSHGVKGDLPKAAYAIHG
jgi:hypothetical protein